MSEPAQRHWIRSRDYGKAMLWMTPYAVLSGLALMAMTEPHTEAIHYWWVFQLFQFALSWIIITALFAANFGIRGTR